MDKKIKTWIKADLIVGLILSLYLSIKGSLTNGWFTCIGTSAVYKCTPIRWIFQIIALALAIAVVFWLIGYGIKYLFKQLFKKEGEKETEEKKQENKKEEKVEEKKEEIKEKKIIKI